MASLDSLFVVPVEEVNVKEESSLEQLTRDKATLENNLMLLFDHLHRHRSDMNTPLLTPDGFPRADIDVLQVRITRAKINIYRNDLAKVLKLIDLKLVEKLSINNKISQMTLDETTSAAAAAVPERKIVNTVPFAIVVEIVEHSPAFQSGLKVNDKIIEIGPINVTNHENLQRLPALISQSEDTALKLVYLRDDDDNHDSIIESSLTPTKNWPGQGLLGCKLKLV